MIRPEREIKRKRGKFKTSFLRVICSQGIAMNLEWLARNFPPSQGAAGQLPSALKAFRFLRIIRIGRNAERYVEHVWATVFVLVRRLLLLFLCINILFNI